MSRRPVYTCDVCGGQGEGAEDKHGTRKRPDGWCELQWFGIASADLPPFMSAHGGTDARGETYSGGLDVCAGCLDAILTAMATRRAERLRDRKPSDPTHKRCNCPGPKPKCGKDLAGGARCTLAQGHASDVCCDIDAAIVAQKAELAAFQTTGDCPDCGHPWRFHERIAGSCGSCHRGESPAPCTSLQPQR